MVLHVVSTSSLAVPIARAGSSSCASFSRSSSSTWGAGSSYEELIGSRAGGEHSGRHHVFGGCCSKLRELKRSCARQRFKNKCRVRCGFRKLCGLDSENSAVELSACAMHGRNLGCTMLRQWRRRLAALAPAVLSFETACDDVQPIFDSGKESFHLVSVRRSALFLAAKPGPTLPRRGSDQSHRAR